MQYWVIQLKFLPLNCKPSQDLWKLMCQKRISCKFEFPIFYGSKKLSSIWKYLDVTIVRVNVEFIYIWKLVCSCVFHSLDIFVNKLWGKKPIIVLFSYIVQSSSFDWTQKNKRISHHPFQHLWIIVTFSISIKLKTLLLHNLIAHLAISH